MARRLRYICHRAAIIGPSYGELSVAYAPVGGASEERVEIHENEVVAS